MNDLIGQVQFPISPQQAVKLFGGNLTQYEKVEIQEYKQIWFLGLNAKKIAGSNSKPYNYGYDDDR